MLGKIQLVGDLPVAEAFDREFHDLILAFRKGPSTRNTSHTPIDQRGAEVDNQVAAPAETGTPNLHRATVAQPRVRMEGWRQRRLG